VNLIVGCPVSHREWILPEWFAHVERACLEIAVIPDYLFVVSENDSGTLETIGEFYAETTREIQTVLTKEPERTDVRVWNEDRYKVMVALRNHLLTAVRERNPDYFLSLDSDILLRWDALRIALQEIGDADALGLHTYMDRPARPPAGTQVVSSVGRNLASKADLRGQQLVNRAHYETYTATHQVGVIMAAKLMTPSAYAIDYEWHFQGEDIGWSKACTKAGLKLVWCPQACAKHVFTKADLGLEDYRVGF
jgi:hypothetical protein